MNKYDIQVRLDSSLSIVLFRPKYATWESIMNMSLFHSSSVRGPKNQVAFESDLHHVDAC